MDETGYLAPGKDMPMIPDNPEERAAAWRVWLRYNENKIEKTLRVIEGMGYA